MNYLKSQRLFVTTIFILLTAASLNQCGKVASDQWTEDFNHQPVSSRPGLEVKYADASRHAFQILAEEYLVTGQLEKPHLLADDQNRPWLWMELEDDQGILYSTKLSADTTRINLYRRGPYFCEVHWFDMHPTSEGGEVAPLSGDLTLYCYPEKMLAEITWHATGNFKASKVHVRGIAPQSFDCFPFAEGTKQNFTFPLFGEEDPLPNQFFTTTMGKVPLHYNYRKGYYEIGTVTSSSFQKQFYEFPNRYETAEFSLTNDDEPRKIYIGHTSVEGGAIVEGGALLDKEGHPMPVLVQVSKNFGGEKEEKFYNPDDTAFSETFFPLYLEPGEQVSLTSLHLYQNWGRHMTKHWSSLGAWMDYFHSSTGVTETTCYVPFKYAGIGGVAIADFRAMGQESFWTGQPQHDNLAGHSFLSFYDGEVWQHSKYESTLYRSTGPNWYDIQINYLSADSSIRIAADIWETPQVDELRSFFHVTYEVLRPITIEDAGANFRFLTITSRIQNLKFTGFATTGTEDMEIDFTKSPFPVKGRKLPSENAFLAVFGDSVKERGSNAIVIRSFKGPHGIGPAASLQTGAYKGRFAMDREDDTRLLLVPDQNKMVLNPGDFFEINGFWLPYGTRDGSETPRREAEQYGIDAPKITSCKKGTILLNLPVKIGAHRNQAKFTLQGGKNLLPVVITGLTEWQYPRIWKKEGSRWSLLSHARNSELDGYQVFSEEGGTFGAVFLVYSDGTEQTLKVSVGKALKEVEQIELVEREGKRIPASVTLIKKDQSIELGLSFPSTSAKVESHVTKKANWNRSEGNSLWFESNEGDWLRGGRISPNQDDLDLEYWWQNKGEGILHTPPEFLMYVEGTPFSDPEGERTWLLTSKGWKSFEEGSTLDISGRGAIAVESKEGGEFLCMAWPRSEEILLDPGVAIGMALEPVTFALRKRYHTRGKVYIHKGNLPSLQDKVNKELK